nr:424_t:CDS:10 [Entrophospora candida]
MKFQTNSYINSSNNKSLDSKNNEKLDFLYGYSVVLPALEQKRRNLVRLFYQETTFSKKQDRQIVNLSKESSIPVVKADKQELNRLVDNRPHQGVVLKASRINPTPIKFLGGYFNESYEIIESNTNSTTICQKSLKNPLLPFWLALDQIVDPQCEGFSILLIFFNKHGVGIEFRSHFKLSSVPRIAKASSGALEIMDLFEVGSLTKFLENSSKNGWIIYGADALEGPKRHNDNFISVNELLLTQSITQNPIILELDKIS